MKVFILTHSTQMAGETHVAGFANQEDALKALHEAAIELVKENEDNEDFTCDGLDPETGEWRLENPYCFDCDDNQYFHQIKITPLEV